MQAFCFQSIYSLSHCSCSTRVIECFDVCFLRTGGCTELRMSSLWCPKVWERDSNSGEFLPSRALVFSSFSHEGAHSNHRVHGLEPSSPIQRFCKWNPEEVIRSWGLCPHEWTRVLILGVGCYKSEFGSSCLSAFHHGMMQQEVLFQVWAPWSWTSQSADL